MRVSLDEAEYKGDKTVPVSESKSTIQCNTSGNTVRYKYLSFNSNITSSTHLNSASLKVTTVKMMTQENTSSSTASYQKDISHLESLTKFFTLTPPSAKRLLTLHTFFSHPDYQPHLHSQVSYWLKFTIPSLPAISSPLVPIEYSLISGSPSSPFLF